ncbi:hypothetical protein [Halothiobacillus sp.]|uniref:hypothetical protein n=1 Tax=Halothiobacillus sp. TaxID=1891311 RepID=UPI002633C6ED|nr:hypothetical protein [Halothiobacillus sp.]
MTTIIAGKEMMSIEIGVEIMNTVIGIETTNIVIGIETMNTVIGMEEMIERFLQTEKSLGSANLAVDMSIPMAMAVSQKSE